MKIIQTKEKLMSIFGLSVLNISYVKKGKFEFSFNHFRKQNGGVRLYCQNNTLLRKKRCFRKKIISLNSGL